MPLQQKPMQYGQCYWRVHNPVCHSLVLVNLGKSGLKVSKLILGCGSYGSKGWSDWVIDDQAEVNKQIKFASVPIAIYMICDSLRAVVMTTEFRRSIPRMWVPRRDR